MTNTVAHLEADACEVAMVSLIADELEKRNVANNSNGNLSESKLDDLMKHLSNYPILGDLNTFSENLPERALCQIIEKRKSFSNARSLNARISDSDHGFNPL